MVIEKGDEEIDIRVVIDLVAVVFSDTGEKTVLNGIDNKWVSACERSIVKLLRGRDPRQYSYRARPARYWFTGNLV